MTTFSPNQIKKALKSLSLLALFSVGLGTCGIGNGSMYFSSLEPPRIDDSPLSKLKSTPTNSAQKFTEILWRSPHRKPLGMLNMGVSFLLILGGFQLWFKRKQAAWWITQAAIANILWITADTGSKIIQVLDHQPEIVEAFKIDQSNQKQPPKMPEETPPADVLITSYLGSLVGWGVFQITFFGWLIFRVRKSDIQFLLQTLPKSSDR